MILAVETATRVMSVALLRGEELLADVTTCDDRMHSERLMPGIDALLREAECSLDSVAAFAVSIGPGSFTGLRIGLATVKGLAFATGKPVAAVPTLAALAAAAQREGPVAALLDARRGEVYAALFPDGAEERVYTPAELAPRLPAGCAVVVGEGAGPAAKELEQLRAGEIELLPESLGRAHAAHVGRLGAALLARGEGAPAAELVPRYVRRAEAEVRRTGRRFE